MQTHDALYTQLLNWYQTKHQFNGQNIPSTKSAALLNQLTDTLLLPIATHFGELTITYGFTGPELARQRKSPAGTAPKLDQHACMELNSQGAAICNRPGAACDFTVQGFADQMHLVTQFICQQLSFDKLYFYGRDRPIHFSVSEQPLKHLQIMQQSERGRRYPGKKAFGGRVQALANEL